MSGGSLNYLYCKDPDDLFNQVDDMECAESYLLRKGYPDIAADVRRLIEYVKTARNRIEVLHDQLKDVFHAVEWRISGDYGDDSLANALEAYRNGGDDQ